MLKYCLILIALFITNLLHAQDNKPVYDRYLDFNLARMAGSTNGALDIGEGMLGGVDSLPPKSKMVFYNAMARLYEDAENPGQAIKYYEKVVAGVPNYYVAHRALGYLYLTPANALQAKADSAGKTSRDYLSFKNQYKAAALKALPHLEIAQACDPSDDTLAIIKNIYLNIGDNTGLTTLDERLKKLGKYCLDLLSDN